VISTFLLQFTGTEIPQKERNRCSFIFPRGTSVCLKVVLLVCQDLRTLIMATVSAAIKLQTN